MSAALSVLEYDLVGYRRVWRGSVLSSFLMPVLFVVGFGFGVGRFVDATGRLHGVSYLAFIAPGMLASTAVQVAFGESAWPIMSKFQWNRTYHALVAAPLRIVDIIAGDLAYLALRLISTSAVFLAVISAFGAVHSAWAFATPLVSALLGLAIATPLFAYTATITSDSAFALIQRVLVIPMSLFAGVFFPLSQLPAAVRWLAYVSPLWHGVELCRAATLPGYAIGPLAVVGHLAYLLLWAGGGLALAMRTFRRRLAE